MRDRAILSCRGDYEKNIIKKSFIPISSLSVLIQLSWYYKAQLLEIDMRWKPAKNVFIASRIFSRGNNAAMAVFSIFLFTPIWSSPIFILDSCTDPSD